jgi:hypothetical protein
MVIKLPLGSSLDTWPQNVVVPHYQHCVDIFFERWILKTLNIRTPPSVAIFPFYLMMNLGIESETH